MTGKNSDSSAATAPSEHSRPLTPEMRPMLIVAGAVGWLTVVALTHPTNLQSISTPAYVLGLLLFAAGFLASTLVMRHSLGFVLWTFGAQLVGYAAVIFASANNLTMILLVILAGQLPFACNAKTSLAIIVFGKCLTLAVLTIYWQTPLHVAFIQAMLFLGFDLFAYTSGRITANEIQQRYAMELKNAELLATRAMLQQSIRHAERLRISRDLHDICGHQLTALSLNLEYLSQTLPESSAAKVREVRHIASELLNQIRAVVSDIRNAKIDLRAALLQMQQHLPSVEFAINGLDDMPLFDDVQSEQLLSICQEAISNALRHGSERRIELTFRTQEGRHLIALSNPCRPASKVTPGSGLRNIHERVAKLCGEVQFHYRDRLWQIELSLPINQEFA